MPPVFGPLSPSKMGLWSCEGSSGRTFSPSVRTKKEASSPVRNSSITTFVPASPNAPRSIMERTASSPSSRERHMMTPLPAARPSAFTTKGGSVSPILASACPMSVKTAYSPVGIPYFFIRFFEKVLLPSSSAAAFEGPKTRRPSFSKKSVIPSQRGCSGPTTVRSTDSFFTNSASELKSPTLIATHSAWRLIPAFPGAQ